jgi:hypothetical protein
MKLAAQAEAKLRELIERGTLPSSQCGRAFLKLIAPLLASGSVVEQKSGAGLQLAVQNADVVCAFHQQQFPAVASSPDAGSRVTSVGRYRDTKALANDTGEIISLRVWQNDIVVKNGKPVSAALLTAAHGVFSFLLTSDCPYELRGPCALVENPAVFAGVERLRLNVGAALYGHGRISNRALDWLARMPSPAFKLLHLPDYDPTGLTEFRRLHSRLGDRAVLHVPTDLETRFSLFCNRALLAKTNTRAMLAQLRRSDSAVIQRIVALIDLHNAGLEHEALLL